MFIVMRHTFQSEQWVPYPRERVFAFFADPANLPPLMPAWQRARVEKAPDAAGEGSLITISFRPVPFFPCGWSGMRSLQNFAGMTSFATNNAEVPSSIFAIAIASARKETEP